MFIVTPDTVLNPGALEMRAVPRRFLGRALLWPCKGLTPGLAGRMVFEAELLRYLVSLLPFVVAMVVWPGSALGIAQAPLLMFMLIYLVEARLLRVPRGSRAGMISEGDLERGLDLLRIRAVTILTRIAAGRGLQDGRLHLVIEQSELVRIAPLTFVSVQSEDGPQVLRLTAAEQALIRAALFQPPLDERQLQRIALAQNEFLQDQALDLRSISAHARLAAMIG